MLDGPRVGLKPGPSGGEQPFKKAGLTVAFVRLPQGMAYALLAGLPPQYGLYTELFGCLFYSLFATSRIGILKLFES